MELKLSNHIRDYRREKHLTQEQLAEALGVTVGAVYKWESGRSMPEISLIMEMADLFEVSVDALLGYQYRSRDRAKLVALLKDLKHVRTLDTLEEADRALRKYPNDFEIVYYAATLYHLRGIEQNDEALTRRCLPLFEKALALIDQNRDPEISDLSILSDIASVQYELGNIAKSIALLKAHNPCDIHAALLGDILSREEGQGEESISYLSVALLDCTANQIIITNGYLNLFVRRQQWQQGLDILDWVLSSLPALKKPGVPNFLQKSEVTFLVVKAVCHLNLEQPEAAADALRRARETALEFDAAPSYLAENIRFVACKERASGHDSMGSTALAAVEKLVGEFDLEALHTLWEEICHEEEN